MTVQKAASVISIFIPNGTPADIRDRLPAFNRPLYEQARVVLDENKAERHIRGGIATRRKYKGE